MRKKIRVTEEHIKNGKPGYISCCPIAIALNEQIEETIFVLEETIFVLRERVCVCGPGFKHVKLPRSARVAIKKFDKSGKMRPFNFFIDV